MLKHPSLLTLFCISLCISLSGCLEAPKAPERFLAADRNTVDHSAFIGMPCSKCHEVKRPEPIIDPNTGFEIVHGNGADCAQCHVAGTTWKGFTNFSHSPTPEACIKCHSDKRPVNIVKGFAHNYPGIGDCVKCHADSAGSSWAGAKFNHDPLPQTCAECHNADRPKDVVNGFSHDGGGSGDCASCHKQPGDTWSGGIFSHNPTPANCSTCHTADRPTVIVSGFDHKIAGMGDCKSCHKNPGVAWTGASFTHSPTPGTCIDCHLSKRPTGLAGSPPFDHSKGGLGDCKSCHKVNIGTNWTGASFSHNPTPASCNDCHSVERPVGLIGNPKFDHAKGGTGDCVSCHKNPGVSWTGGSFSHSPTPSTCIDCHLSKRPVSPVNGFDHTKGGLGDCKSCHKNVGVSWAGATFDHNPAPATCANCHANQRPAALKNGFLHSFAGTGDCKSCHNTNRGITWSGGIYSHSPTPTQCSVCHTADRPVGLVGPNGNKFDHANGGMGDCKSCHLGNMGVNWTGGSFSHSPTPSSCANCHTADRPVGLVGPNGNKFDHAKGGTGDCKSCHLANIGVNWTGGNFSHSPTPATCASCHAADKPTGLATKVSTQNPSRYNQFSHSIANLGDCKNCHKTNIGTNWTGGTYNHNPSPTSCNTCHLISRPSTNVNGFNHSTDGTGDCIECHNKPGVSWTGAASLPSKVSLLAPTGQNWATVATAHPKIDSTKAGLTCTTCHGNDTKAKIINYDHNNPVSGSKCVYCHYSKQVNVGISIDTASHRSTGINKDCNASGCHTRPSMPSWSTTNKKWSGGGW